LTAGRIKRLSDAFATTQAYRTTAAAMVSAAIPARTFKGMSAMISLRRLWKIPRLKTSIVCRNFHVNKFWDTKATIATLRAFAARTAYRAR
jgi:hypothetical protein